MSDQPIEDPSSDGDHPEPGDAAGVSVPSDQSAPGTSETAKRVDAPMTPEDPDPPPA